MKNIWITSDWHFCHDKEFVYKPRGFDTVQDMNEGIITEFNSMVDNDDEVYCLGDLMLVDNDEGLRCVSRLKGNLHIILGNHDSSARQALYRELPNVVDIAYAARLPFSKKTDFFLSHYPCLCGNYDDFKGRRTVSLCGHSHTPNPLADTDKGLIYHCEVDAHNCRPVSLDDIATQINLLFS